MTISQRIFELLREQGKKASDLSYSTGISSKTISAWKSNGTNPTAEKLLAIANFLSVSTDYLLSGEETTDIKTNNANNVSTGDISNNSGVVGVGHNHAPVTITIKNGEERTRQLSKQESDLLDIYNDVDGYEQNEIMNFVYKYKK